MTEPLKTIGYSPNKTIRTFVAVRIFPDHKLVTLFSGLRKEMAENKLNWTNLFDLHITLKFLGDTPLELLEKINDILNNIAGTCKPFTLLLEGTGLFFSGKAPRVLYAGIKENEALSAMAYEIDNQLKCLGFPLETRTFHPHLTLARVKYVANKDVFISLTDQYRTYRIQEVTISEMVLFKSMITSSGPKYEPLNVFSFSKNHDFS